MAGKWSVYPVVPYTDALCNQSLKKVLPEHQGKSLLLPGVHHNSSPTVVQPKPSITSLKDNNCPPPLKAKQAQLSVQLHLLDYCFFPGPRHAAVHCGLLFKAYFVSQCVHEEAMCTELNSSTGLSGHSAVH